MSVEDLVRRGEMMPVGYLKKVYSTAFVDADFMQPDEFHIVLFFFDERHSIVTSALEAEDPDSILSTFAFNMKEYLSIYGADVVNAYLLRPNEKRKRTSVMLSVVFICTVEAEYAVSDEGKRTILGGVYRKLSVETDSNFRRRGGPVSMRRCITIANHILKPDGYSYDVISLNHEINEIGVKVQYKRAETIIRNYNAMVKMRFFSDGYMMEDLVEVVTNFVPKLGKNNIDSAINAYKSLISDTIRGAFSRYAFVVYGNVRYLCKRRLLEYIVGKKMSVPKQDIGVNDLILAVEDSDADVGDEETDDVENDEDIEYNIN